MKCLSCDCILKGHEDARKYRASDERISLCDRCLRDVGSDIDMVSEDWENDEAVVDFDHGEADVDRIDNWDFDDYSDE